MTPRALTDAEELAEATTDPTVRVIRLPDVPATGHCFLWLHRWSRWSCAYPMDDADPAGPRMQARLCLRCGLMQERGL